MAAMMITKLLLLLSLQGAAASTIHFTDITVHASNNSISGYAGVNISGTFGYICDTASTPGDIVPEHNILVICNQFGYANGSGYRTTFPQSGTVRLRDVNCTSTESDIVDCKGTTGTFSTTSCPNGAYRINCFYPYYDMYTNMRLAEDDGKKGFVEIRPEPSDTWKQVCIDENLDNWDKKARDVACRQLGYDTSKEYPYRTGSALEFVRSPECKGNENNLTQCEDSDKLIFSFRSDTCQSAGVSCSDRLPEYSFNYDRQEIYVNKYWEPLCGASLVTDNEQKGLGLAVCKTLGREYISHSKDFTLYEPSTTQLRYIGCPWEVKNLTDCFKLKAPDGKGFPCYYRMKVECKEVHKDGTDWGLINWVLNGLRVGLPVLLFAGGGIIVLIFWCVQVKNKKRRRGQVSHSGQVAGISMVSAGAAGAMAMPQQGDYKAGYPVGHMGGQSYPTQLQPGMRGVVLAPTAPAGLDAAPPSYRQTAYTDWSNNTNNNANFNDDPNGVPQAVQYINPYMPQHLPTAH